MQFSLRSLMLATVIVAVLLSLISLRVGLEWLVGASVIGAVTGRVVAGERIGCFVGCLYGTVAAGAAVVGVAMVAFSMRRSADIGFMTFATLGAYFLGAVLGGAIGGWDARPAGRSATKSADPQRNASRSRSRAASREKLT